MEGRDVVDSVAEQSEEVPNDDENGHENLPSDEPDASDSEGSRDVSGDEVGINIIARIGEITGRLK